MHSVFILGSARSGTSMTAGLFQQSGAFAGQQLLPPTSANPYGYFEDRRVNDLNNNIIQYIVGWPRLNRIRKLFAPTAHIDFRAFPLAAPRTLWKRHPPERLVERMRQVLEHQPFCFKDPRFCVTLPYWRSLLPADVRFLVVFRHPSNTVDSMLRNSREIYNPPLEVDDQWCYTSWYRNYSRLLHDFSREGRWLFVHYEQVIRGERLPEIAEFTDTILHPDQLDRSISRSAATTDESLPVVQRCLKLYGELCLKAEYSPNSAKTGGARANRIYV